MFGGLIVLNGGDLEATHIIEAQNITHRQQTSKVASNFLPSSQKRRRFNGRQRLNTISSDKCSWATSASKQRSRKLVPCWVALQYFHSIEVPVSGSKDVWKKLSKFYAKVQLPPHAREHILTS